MINKDSPIKICIECTVKKILHDHSGKATGLETSLGYLSLGNAKLILAMGTLPPTTLMLNSFPKSDYPQLANIGERFTAHFSTKIVARVPRTTFLHNKEFENLEMAAFYVAGVDKSSKSRFHIQVAAISDTDPENNEQDAFQLYPGASPTPQWLSPSKEHIVITCTTVGQLDHINKENWFRLNDHDDNHDITTNCKLQCVTNQADNDLWDTMDEATFQVIEQEIAKGENIVEYWHREKSSDTCDWKNTRPTKPMIRKEATVHEASTMWIGGEQDKDAPVGLDYRPKGVDNVYITGGSLYPTGASWNPTGVMVAMAMHLGDLLEPKRKNDLVQSKL